MPIVTPSTQLLRTARTWHRKTASVLFVFFFVISVTGVLLGWKNLFSGTIFKSVGKQRSAGSVKEWLPLDSLSRLAIGSLHKIQPLIPEGYPERIDARMDKGYVRILFSNQYNVQLNAQTGELQSIDKKAPDWIIRLHDGEMIDDLFGIKNEGGKKTYASVMGLALFFLTLSGFWMWFKPKQIKNAKKGTANP
jgi:hypothetical protein